MTKPVLDKTQHQDDKELGMILLVPVVTGLVAVIVTIVKDMVQLWS